MIRRISKAQQQALALIAQRESTPRYTYRQLRRAAVATFGCDESIALPWCDMWLCVELDGYVHS